MKIPRICINEDNGHFYAHRTMDAMTEDGVRSLVDEYAAMGVDALFFCTNIRRALFDSKAWEPVYFGYDPDLGMHQPALKGMTEDEKKQKIGNENLSLMHNLWLLKERGVDHYKIWLEQCVKHGMEGWLTVRMNDLHHSDNLDHFWHSTLWKTRPDLWRVQHKFESWWDRAFDYGKKEVRDHHFALIRELLERYDPYGIELDWIRSIFHFSPGMEEKGRKILTSFVSEVKDLINEWSEKRGHKIKLSVRIPESPETSVRLGMDAPEWIRLGLVDQIVLSQWLSVISFDSPIGIWNAIIGDSEVDVALNVSTSFLPYSVAWKRKAGCEATLEMLRGVANSAAYNGADRLYFFNYCYFSTRDPEFLREVISDAKSETALSNKSRRHLISPLEISAPGESENSVLPVSFADENGPSKYGRAITLYPNVGYAVPVKGNVYAVIGFDKELPAPLSTLELEVRVNCELCDVSRNVELPTPIAKIADPVFIFEIPKNTLHNGRNAVEILPKDESTQGSVVWCEIYICENSTV